MGVQEWTGPTVGDLAHLAPELTVAASFLLLLLLDLFLPRTVNRNLIGWLALAGTVAAAVLVGYQINPAETVSLLEGSYRIDDFGNVLKLVFFAGTGLVLLMSIGSLKREEITSEGEYYYLLLAAVLGAMIMASSSDLIILYVGLETLSLSSYVLAGIRKKNRKANEGAFKYLIQGGISSAVILYGMSFLYGISGSTQLISINEAVQSADMSLIPLIYVAFILLLAGFGFKIAAAPFHTWAPDTYQGASTPIAAFLAVVSKGAGLAVIFRLFYGVFFQQTLLRGENISGLEYDVFLAIMILAAMSMIVGNLLALRQKNMKRLFAYSGIANAGYLLVPIGIQFSVVHLTNFSELIYYLIAYLLMTIGAFAAVMIVERLSGTEELSGFAGLYYRSPGTAVAMLLLVLSLAGFPVTAGFFGKLFILFGAVQLRMYALALIMAATSVLSFYYSFSILRQMFMRGEIGETRGEKIPWTLNAVLWFCAVAGIVLGFYPQGILSELQNIFSVVGMDLF
ncbi:NADH-quinone oxidoreductase subunit N [Gorillibacterium timonense]|uniref:NADH-quinone oxidoreductase subunit N n=1 Tax=Gorillibacterium timonense TaxID=1689269 RepID=UPI00071E3901|nr:NADH-quinone oxidoreductase subunit N [Gorillibacterium timonense]